MERQMASACSLIKKVPSTRGRSKTINIMGTVSRPGTSIAQDMRDSLSKERKLAKESLNSMKIAMKEISLMDFSMVRASIISLKPRRFMRANSKTMLSPAKE